MEQPSAQKPSLEHTPLDELHRARGARMVPFAGYEMPLHYADGIVAEHLHTRSSASVFDVSHMGQAILVGPSWSELGHAFEQFVPSAIASLTPGQMRYTLLLNDEGGCRDDLIVTRPAEHSPLGSDCLLIVSNAAYKAGDFAFIEEQNIGELTVWADRALLAIQGPNAAATIGRLPLNCEQELAGLPFMHSCAGSFRGSEITIFRSGYTGEDGFEVSVAAHHAPDFVQALLEADGIALAGLGARDSLRLEAGLCLMGQDLDATTSPVEAGLSWTIARPRRAAADFPGADRILAELANGPARRRVGIRPAGRAVVRAGAPVTGIGGQVLGTVTSGGYGPSVAGAIAMGYVTPDAGLPGRDIAVEIRGKSVPARIADLPFVAPRYYRP